MRFAFRLCAILWFLSLLSLVMAQDSGKRISQTEAVEDVREYFSTVQRVHPDLLAKVSLDDYIKLKKQTIDYIAEKTDKDGKISVSDLAYQLYYVAAFFKDGHTTVSWRELNPNVSNMRFPSFLLGYDNGRFIVSSSSNKSIDGLEVLSINGIQIREFLRPILDRISGETFTFKAFQFTVFQTFWFAFSNLIGSAESLTLRLRDSNGKESEQTVETLSSVDVKKLGSERNVIKLVKMQQQGSHVLFFNSDKTAYFGYPAFKFTDDEKKKIDSIFNEIKTRKSQNLIIDIRGNGGGNSSMGDFIFSYLYAGKFCPFSKIRARLSQDVLESEAKGWIMPEDADLDGIVVTENIGDKSFPKPQAFFSGSVFLLVDNCTFSSATDFATMFRDYKAGKILGYETGGLPCCFGDVHSFKLKNSGIQCGVSWKQFFGPKPKPGDDEHGVIPDIPMSEKLLRPYQKKDDPVLAFTLDHIKKTHHIR